MLSIRRLLWIVALTVCISLFFLLINFRDEVREEIKVENEKYVMDPLMENDIEAGSFPYQFVLVADQEQNMVYENISDILDGWKMPYEVMDEVREYDKNKIYVFCMDEIMEHTELPSVVDYVESGGMVVFANGISEGNLETYITPLFGISYKSNKISVNRFRFAEDFLPFQEEVMTYDGYNASTWIELREKATVYVEDEEKGTPVVYSYPYGKGRSLVINGTLMEDKQCSGMFAGLLSNEMKGFAYPILNTETVFLDNFPVVTYIDDEACLKYFGRKTDDFVQNVVWPVFQKAALGNEIKYTASVLTAGTGDIYFPQLEDALFYNMGKSALLYDGELTEAIDFSNPGQFVENNLFREKFHEFFPNYQLYSCAVMNGAYSGEISRMSEKVVIRGYLFGDPDTMFLCEPKSEDGIYYYPVVADGLDLEKGTLFFTAMQIASKGMMSQRIDINTLICDEEGKQAWDEAKVQLSDFEERVLKPLRWMDAVTLSETANNINGIENLKYTIQYGEEGIVITLSKYRKGQSFMIHSDKEIENAVGAEIMSINHGYYIVKILEDRVELQFS